MMGDELRRRVRIRSENLSAFEAYSGGNLVMWSMKYVYHALAEIQEEMRSEKNYEVADRIRNLRSELKRGYSYKLPDIEELKEVKESK